MLEPSDAHVVTAVHSLCADALKPLGRVILKRLREHVAATEAERCGLPVAEVDPESVPRIDPKQLRKICEACLELNVFPEEGKEYSAVPNGLTPHFINVCSPEDPYSAALWEEITGFLEGLAVEGTSLPCGRYACAQAIVARQLPSLVGLSLGQVCHVVQLAVSARRLLGHRGGRLVPFQVSDECAKEQCALRQEPFASKKAGELPVATWELTRRCLQQLLAPEKTTLEAGVMLSDVKRLFHRQFNVDLNETALGYTRVFDLLQDARLHDVCTVHSQGSGQVVVRRVDLTATSPSAHAWLHMPGRLEAGDRVPQFPFHLGGMPQMPAMLPEAPVCLSTMPMPCFIAPPAPSPQMTHFQRPSPLASTLPKLPVAPDINAWELVSPGASPRGTPSAASPSVGEEVWSSASNVSNGSDRSSPSYKCEGPEVVGAVNQVGLQAAMRKGCCMGRMTYLDQKPCTRSTRVPTYSF